MRFCIKIVVLNRPYIQQLCNHSENYYIPQKPENLRFAPVIIALLIDIFDNIITYSLYSPVLRHQNFRQ